MFWVQVRRDGLIVLGADVLNVFLALTQLPQELAAMILEAELTPMVVLIIILVFYVIGGCVMDSLSMILLTVLFSADTGGNGLRHGCRGRQSLVWYRRADRC